MHINHALLSNINVFCHLDSNMGQFWNFFPLRAMFLSRIMLLSVSNNFLHLGGIYTEPGRP